LAATEPDTVKRHIRINAFLATSFIINQNWEELSRNSVLLAGNININYCKKSNGFMRVNELRSELAYLRFIDSLWIKNTDRIFLSSTWTLGTLRSLKNSFFISLKTQLTDTWTENGTTHNRKWRSGPLQPAVLTPGYGVNWELWQRSFLTISFASMKITSVVAGKSPPPESKLVARSGTMTIFSEYGLNLQSSIYKPLSKKLTWENYTTFFASGINKEVISLDMQNLLSYRPSKNFKLRIESRLLFDILQSPYLQSRTEILLGYYFSKM
jgi:hypothetical protein